MNPRILELAEQSTEKIHRFSYSLGHRTETMFDHEKFAELIVRECAQYIFVLDAEPVSHKTAAALLLQHFEIKQ